MNFVRSVRCIAVAPALPPGRAYSVLPRSIQIFFMGM
jgi:hypothetical protein